MVASAVMMMPMDLSATFGKPLGIIVTAVLFATPWQRGGVAFAQCTLAPGAALRIGCTVDCSEDYVESALRQAADRLGYKIESIARIANASDAVRYDAIVSPGGHDIDPKYFTW